MKNKRVLIFATIILIIIFIIIIGCIILKGKKNNNKITEFIPPEEIAENQLRNTNITLFFIDKNTGELATEVVKIDSKELLKNPEKTLIKLLINGPQETNNLERIFPENTKILDINVDHGVVILNLSSEFLTITDLEDKKKEMILEAIKQTLLQLNEINKIIININGEYYFEK